MLHNWSDLGNMPWDTSGQSAASLTEAVSFLYRCIDVRANTLASMPWSLLRGDEEIANDDTDEMPVGLEYLDNLTTHLHRIEYALCTGSRAYLYKQANRIRVKGLQWLDPATMEVVWTPSGVFGYKRRLDGGKEYTLTPDEVIYIWRQGLSETEPASPPVRAALNAARVLSSVDLFAKGFFERGAIKGTILQAEGNPPAAEKERLKAWWKRMFGGGNKTAWEAEVVSSMVTPVVIGEGISELSNANLTNEKREDIATAMGVPHSMVLSNATNFAVSESDRLNFYDTTIVPECRMIQRQMNEQLFMPLGMRLEFRPEQLPVYQADEGERSQSFATYVNAGIKQSIAAQLVGLDLPEGITFDQLDEIAEEQREMAKAAFEDNGNEDEDNEQRSEEEKRFIRWAKRRMSPDVTKFASTILTDAEKAALLGEKGTPFPVATWGTYP